MDAFIWKLLISFIVGAGYVTFSTIVAEKYGSKIGGFIAGLPSTILFSVFFIGWTQGTSACIESVRLVPIMNAVNIIFILIFMFLSRFGFWLSLLSSIGFWSLISYVLIRVRWDYFWESVLIYAIIGVSAYFIMENILKVKSQGRKRIRVSAGNIIFRSSISGLLILSSVVIAKISSPVIGGLFGMLPVMFIGTMIITYLAHGKEFSSSVMKISIIMASSIVVFGILVRLTFSHFGLFLGTAISYIASFLYAIAVFLFIRKFMT